MARLGRRGSSEKRSRAANIGAGVCLNWHQTLGQHCIRGGSICGLLAKLCSSCATSRGGMPLANNRFPQARSPANGHAPASRHSRSRKIDDKLRRRWGTRFLGWDAAFGVSLLRFETAQHCLFSTGRMGSTALCGDLPYFVTPNRP